MTLKYLPIFAIAMTTASAATAQGVEYLSYGVNYTNLSVDGGDADLFSLGASVDFRVNDAFVNGAISYADISGDGGNESITGISARGGYFVVPQAVIYGGLNFVDTSESDSLNTYNVGAEYAFNAFTVGLNYDDSDQAGYIETTTLYAGYQASDAVEIAVGVSDTDGENTAQVSFDFDNGQYDVSALYVGADGLNLFGFDAAYNFGNGFRTSGNYVSLDGDADILSIGGGYEVSQDMWVDLEVGRVNVDGGGSADVIGLALTYEMGSETLLIDRAESTQIEALGVLGQIAELGGF
jgi:hypothetical protein